jgi:hypothetical protein
VDDIVERYGLIHLEHDRRVPAARAASTQRPGAGHYRRSAVLPAPHRKPGVGATHPVPLVECMRCPKSRAGWSGCARRRPRLSLALNTSAMTR